MIDLNGDLKQNLIATQQRGELYMRMYKYMAQDWVNNSDMDKFVTTLLSWVESVEERMQTLSSALQSHTHPITPHVHTIPSHVHTIPPHTHVAPTYGGITTPAILSTNPGTSGSTDVNSQIDTGTPTEPTSLQWNSSHIPSRYINTTGAVSNIATNSVVVGTSVIGSYSPHERRALIVPEAATPNVPPYLTPTIV